MKKGPSRSATADQDIDPSEGAADREPSQAEEIQLLNGRQSDQMARGLAGDRLVGR
jgi:hypothetical protein